MKILPKHHISYFSVCCVTHLTEQMVSVAGAVFNSFTEQMVSVAGAVVTSFTEQMVSVFLVMRVYFIAN